MKSLLTLTAAAMLLLAPALAFAGQKTSTTATAVGGYAGVVHNGFTAGNTFNAATVIGTRGSAVSVSTDIGVAAGRNASAAGFAGASASVSTTGGNQY